MIDAATVIPPPHRDDQSDQEMWTDEQIWGHRLRDSQSPWLLFLEFLGVAEAMFRRGALLQRSEELIQFKPFQRMALRNVLFNNETLVRIVERTPDSGAAWTEWLKWMEDNSKFAPSRDYSYLRKRFPTFQQFAALVAMLRASAVESETSRRWTSRFVFPFGSKALYEDLDVTPSGTVSRGYNNFTRTGELLYLMLSRSISVERLRPHVEALIAGNNVWNSVVGRLQADGVEDGQTRGKSYLPYRRHASFDSLADDWLSVFELKLSGFDAMPHLVALAAFHVMLYQLNVAAEWAEETRPVSYVCEVVAPKKTLIRELSARNYQSNIQLPERALRAYLGTIEASDEWRQLAAQQGTFGRCRAILRDRVGWPQNDDYDGPNDPAELLSELKRRALARHKQHVAHVHRTYGRSVGLVSKRGTNRLRYAPTDSLLKSLILANVPHRMEYKDFLARMHGRYGLIFGDREAEVALDRGEFDRTTFKANADRLEQRLGSLGMLKRLSDACAYVQNPFARSGS